MHQFDDTISQRFFVRISFALAGEGVDWGAARDFQAIAAARSWSGGSTIPASAPGYSSWCRTWITAWRICSTHRTAELKWTSRGGGRPCDAAAMRRATTCRSFTCGHCGQQIRTGAALLELIESTRTSWWCSHATCRSCRTICASGCGARHQHTHSFLRDSRVRNPTTGL